MEIVRCEEFGLPFFQSLLNVTRISPFNLAFCPQNLSPQDPLLVTNLHSKFLDMSTPFPDSFNFFLLHVHQRLFELMRLRLLWMVAILRNRNSSKLCSIASCKLTWIPKCRSCYYKLYGSLNIYVTVLSLLEMHSGGNVRRPRCRPSSPGVLGASDLILIYYWGGLRSVAPTGGSPCSTVLWHLRAANALVRV